MKFEAVTIKDIAKELGISTSTVSRALRDSYEISIETKKLVQECAERLDYRPNPIALSLKEKRSRSLGVVVCEIANSFFSQAINGIESIAYSRGYNVIISQSNESFEREVTNLKYLSSRSIDGLLISLSSQSDKTDHLKSLHNRGLPIVFFDRITEEVLTHRVIVDNYKATYEATNHLLDNGYKRISCIVNAAHLSIAKERIAGYKQALTERGITFDEGLIKRCQKGGAIPEEVERAVNEILKMNPRPDAIIGLTDKLTTGALRVLKSRRIEVPGEMGLLGFSNSDLTELLEPSLTIIRQPAFEMGQIATELLINLIESKRPTLEFTRKVLETELIIRQSTSRR
ncbi:LacI family transcriptional regulator [Segetibacter sp. 3557_3]|uniref:LacI family DNA-binding transcriptional regulator n=1 Tax=Segetibacter sp. 3557_3 TaxID=2547429 RepID=UPI0010591124|nr:LacI family DNA-binding transcriptional regulator [Segetibacter sp. 3557_3]TDH27763.1 LacI family transcriptional regulator [Segetibacter sp. 3557_3]